MSREPFRRYTRRAPTSAADQNAVRQRVEDHSRDRPASGGGLHSAARAGAQVLVCDVAEPVWLEITGPGVTSIRFEDWEERTDDGDGGWVAPADGLTGSASLPAFVPPGWPDPSVGDFVLALPSGDGASLIMLTPTPASLAAGSPLTTKGDIWVYSTLDTRLPVGTDGFLLSADSTQATGLKWVSAGGAISPLTTKGDVWVYSTGDTRLPVGTNGQVLTADSTQATGLKWNDLVDIVVSLGEVTFQAERVSWSADQDDLSIDPKTTFLNVEPTVSGVTLTGIAGGANGRLLYIVNRDVSQDLTLAHDSASSAAGNRLQLPNAADVTLFQNEGIALYYSETDACWFALDEAAGGAAPAFSGARVYHNGGTQTFSSGSPYPQGVVLFDSERYDTDSYHDTTTNKSRLTIPATGKYRVGANMVLSGPTTATPHFFWGVFLLNGVGTIGSQGAPSMIDPPGSNTGVLVNFSADWDFTAGDYVEVLAAGHDTSVLVGNGCSFWIEKLD